MRRLEDQVLILRAIAQVRDELILHQHESWLVIMEIMTRLATLYSLLNVTMLERLASEADSRDEREVA